MGLTLSLTINPNRPIGKRIRPMRRFVLLLSLLCIHVAAYSQDNLFVGDWKRMTNHWDPKTESYVPVIEILRISRTDSGRYYISGKVINASDGATRSYNNINDVRHAKNELFYSEDWGYHIQYFKLSFDGEVATRVRLYMIDKADGSKTPINRTEGEYYRNNDNW